MKVRIRHPAGQAAVTLSDAATVLDLVQRVKDISLLDTFDLKIGYPPEPLRLEEFEVTTPLIRTGKKYDGEQLIVSRTSPPTPPSHSANRHPEKSSNIAQTSESGDEQSNPVFSFAGFGAAPPTANPSYLSNPLSLSRKSNNIEQDPPEIALATHNATMVLRVVPDDNACLFRAFNTAFFGSMDNMHELRSVVAQNIQADPDTYSAVVLEKNPDDYCRWIQTSDAWGGAIELDIFSKHFDIEICSIDVQSLRIDRYNEDRPNRCILVYSGIHYDAIALSPSDPPHMHSNLPPEYDTKVFDSSDERILQAAIELCTVLKGRKYFTDTAKFNLKCKTCGALLMGESGASEHALATSHVDFGEAE
ncbi:uncharacterized protein KY384_005921 [Bacidia gigantensis]|uniref:uncharacterized protein n=1 Tax=Bacidia gigantensis TaxID=2732470 RepID=UPI001D0366C9|nr:uncharacterized protein KY384_005921 [Bacidia gigantensis]KAG8529286.1 hypothetical protein KY384_005921 [Bacidia gigantensis]